MPGHYKKTANQSDYCSHTAVSTKVVGKMCTWQSRKNGIWSIHCSWHLSCRAPFCCFSLALANIRPWPLVPFFQISLKNSELQNHPQNFSGLSRALFSDNLFRNSCIIKEDHEQLTLLKIYYCVKYTLHERWEQGGSGTRTPILRYG